MDVLSSALSAHLLHESASLSEPIDLSLLSSLCHRMSPLALRATSALLRHPEFLALWLQHVPAAAPDSASRLQRWIKLKLFAGESADALVPGLVYRVRSPGCGAAFPDVPGCWKEKTVQRVCDFLMGIHGTSAELEMLCWERRSVARLRLEMYSVIKNKNEREIPAGLQFTICLAVHEQLGRQLLFKDELKEMLFKAIDAAWRICMLEYLLQAAVLRLREEHWRALLDGRHGFYISDKVSNSNKSFYQIDFTELCDLDALSFIVKEMGSGSGKKSSCIVYRGSGFIIRTVNSRAEELLHCDVSIESISKLCPVCGKAMSTKLLPENAKLIPFSYLLYFFFPHTEIFMFHDNLLVNRCTYCGDKEELSLTQTHSNSYILQTILYKKTMPTKTQIFIEGPIPLQRWSLSMLNSADNFSAIKRHITLELNEFLDCIQQLFKLVKVSNEDAYLERPVRRIYDRILCSSRLLHSNDLVELMLMSYELKTIYSDFVASMMSSMSSEFLSKLASISPSGYGSLDLQRDLNSALSPWQESRSFCSVILPCFITEPSSMYSVSLLSKRHIVFTHGQLDLEKFSTVPEFLDIFRSTVREVNFASDHETNAPRHVALNLSGTASVRIYFAREFYKVRKEFCVYEPSFMSSINRCRPWYTSGGKSKAKFYRTLDGLYLLKAIDHQQFMNFCSFADKFFSCITECRMIVPILGIFSVSDSIKSSDDLRESFFIVTPFVLENFDKNGSHTFDLKGLTRGRFVEVFQKHREPLMANLVFLDGNLSDFTQRLPIILSPQTHAWFHDELQKASEFLSSIGVIDYSLLVSAEADSEPMEFSARCGIVDYLTVYNFEKKLESNLKRAFSPHPDANGPTILNPIEYQARFVKAFKSIFVNFPPKT